MKKLINQQHYFILIAFLVSTLFIGCGNECENCSFTNKDSFRAKASHKSSNSQTSQQTSNNSVEDTLAISTTTIAVTEACGMINDGLTLLEVNNSNFPALIEEIDSVSLHDMQRNLRGIKMNDPYCYNYITGIKVWLGLNNRTDTQDSIKLLYQPVYMCRNNSDSIYTVSYTSPVYFKYEHGAFVPASQYDLDGLERYKTRIHFNSPIPRGFRERPDSTGDTKAVYYTFQELDSVMIKNNVDKIRIWNFAVRLKIGLVKYTKHSLMLSPTNIGCDKIKPGAKKLDFFIALDFAGKFADRSHLCPPSCEALFYRRIGNTQ